MRATFPKPFVAPAPRTLPDEQGARRTLREQIARLEAEMCALSSSAWPRQSAWTQPSLFPPARDGAHLLSLGELEELRDALSHRLADGRRELAARARAEEGARRLVEEMLLDPAGHRWARVMSADLGEPGCRSFHVRPPAGLLGMLAGWWRVVVSSGCP